MVFTMNYLEELNYLGSANKFSVNLGLERITKLCDMMGNPQKNLKVIHIAGTNGKGSVAACLLSILMDAGFRVGFFTSPALERFTERIRINKEEISLADTAKYLGYVRGFCEKEVKEGFEHPVEFEMVTAAALKYFYDKKVDIVILEVGLGGRIDSTNVVTPILSIITSISYDHMNILGSTLEEITREKAGIIKEGVTVVSSTQLGEAYNVIKETCTLKRSKLVNVAKSCAQYLGTIEYEKHLLQGVKISADDEEYLFAAKLLGTYQLDNMSTAVFAAREINLFGVEVSHKNIINGLNSVSWPGRLEVMSTEPYVVIDGAHNIDGIYKLKESIEKYFKYKNLYLIFGVLSDKQVEEMVRVISPMAKSMICLSPNNERAEDSNLLLKTVKKYNKNCIIETDYAQAYKTVIKCSSNKDLILICGSLYMIGDMRKTIRGLKKDNLI